MKTKESLLIDQSRQSDMLFKEGDVVQATVKMGAKIPVGKTGVVTEMYGTPPNVGYEVDFLPLGHTVTVMPHQIELKKPLAQRTPGHAGKASIPEYKSNNLK